MQCPITLRFSEWFGSHKSPFESVRAQRTWSLCRHLIILCGNFLTLVYALMVLISIKYTNDNHIGSFDYPDRPFDFPSAHNVAVQVMVISIIGCASVFIKTQCRDCLEVLANRQDCYASQPSKPITRIVAHNAANTLVSSAVMCARRKANLIKKCLLYSPILTVNCLVLVIVFPFEVSLAKNLTTYLVNNYKDLKTEEKTHTKSVYLVISCLEVLIVSIILVQITIFVYICDLIKSSLDRHYKRRRLFFARNANDEENKQGNNPGNPYTDQQIQARARIQELRKQNILFNQYLRSKPKATTPKKYKPSKIRTISAATTVGAGYSKHDWAAKPDSYVAHL